MRNFKPEDFEGSGQYIIREYNPETVKTGTFISTILFKIGYINNPYMEGKIFIVSMSDGWLRNFDFDKSENRMTPKYFRNKEDLCNSLNNPNNQEYRFATEDEIIRGVRGALRKENKSVKI